jgi:hypothetical protein
LGLFAAPAWASKPKPDCSEAHAWFSFDGVATDRVYLFGNVGRQTEPYGLNGGNNSGKILKFNDDDVPSIGPLYIFHNSFFTSQDFISEGRTKDLRVWSNAIYFTGAGTPVGADASWQASYLFDHNVMNKPLPSAAHATQATQETVADPGFADGASGALSLGPKSAAVDAGRAFDLVGTSSQFDGQAPDAGAFEGTHRYIGPTYQRI